MGFSEDDRIRAKNKASQEAFDLYEGLIAMGYDSAYAVKYAEFALQSCSDPDRNEILNKVISIAQGVSNEKVNSN